MTLCPRCGYRAPFHKPDCGENFACRCPRGGGDPDALLKCMCEASNHPLRDEANRNALPGRDARDAVEVTQRSRFTKHEQESA